MKKIIYSIIISMFVFSCSLLQIDESKYVHTSEIKQVLTEKVGNEIDLKIARAKSKISSVSLDSNTNRLNIVFELEVTHALNAMFGLSGEKLQVIANTNYVLRDNKIIAKDVRVSNVLGLGEQGYLVKEITNFIANVTLENTVLYDFNKVERFRNRKILNILPSFNSFYVNFY